MKIIIKVGERDDFRTEEMSIDGDERLYVGPLSDCPEDAIIERDLVSCCQVVEFMREAYDAGKRGEELTIKMQRTRQGASPLMEVSPPSGVGQASHP